VGSRNLLLLDYGEAINAARNQPRWHKLKMRTVDPQLRSVYDRQHTSIVLALVERDADGARRAMQQHLATVREHMLATR
jgi:DNA-binding FadR family transcriptional regulator